MKKKLVAAMFLVIIFCLTLSGCNDEVVPPPPGTLPEILTAEKIDTDIYFDATVSMSGFTTLAAGNVYRSLPDILGDICGAWGKVRFYRFGEQVEELSGREYRRMINPEWYTETITSFGSVVEGADEEHLSVVITDLFESEADWSNVTQKIREKYFANHKAVGIIGIKNSFNGEIFDVGLNAAKFSYNSADDPSRYRPFYLFLMGSEAAVRTFLEQWQAHKPPASEMEYVVFSEYFTKEVMTFRVADAAAKDKNNLFEDKRLAKADDRLQEISIPNRDKNVEITLPGNLQQYPYACPLIKDKVDKKVKVFALSEGNWQPQEGKNAEVTFDWFEECDENGNNCLLKVSFLPNSTLPPRNIGLLQVQIVPSKQSVALPDWIARWDMGNIDLSPELFDGAKTVNLERIAASLKDSLLADRHPPIAELFLLAQGR